MVVIFLTLLRRGAVNALPSPLELGMLERFPVPTVAVADDGAVLFANTAFARATDE
jgi:hypothetical protein